jgi:hypothetical protein
MVLKSIWIYLTYLDVLDTFEKWYTFFLITPSFMKNYLFGVFLRKVLTFSMRTLIWIDSSLIWIDFGFQTLMIWLALPLGLN